MERKSAWSLPMSEQEIVNEYKAAKRPQSQIAILADQNGCEKKTIVNILEAAGCELPGNYKKKKKELLEEDPEEPYKPPFVIKEVEGEVPAFILGPGGAGASGGSGCREAVPDFSKVQPLNEQQQANYKANTEPEEEPLPIAVHVRLAALRSIERMIPEDGDIEDVDHTIFAQRVAGILQLVWEVEHGNY